MTLDQAIAFFLFAVVAAVTPGPSNAMIVATASSVGILRGLPCALGAPVGMGLLIFASALGLAGAVASVPLLLKVLNWGGAAFLLYLAWKTATSGHPGEAAATRPVGFVGSALFQWINPKGWLVTASAAGTFLSGGSTSALVQATAFGLIFFAAALPSALVWLLVGGALRNFLRNEKAARIFNIVMGLVLAASVLLLFH